MEIAKLDVYSPRGQTVILLLSTLFDLKGGRRRQEVLSVIRNKQWYALEPEDRKPYPSSNSREPRWENLISWARLSCVDEKLMEREIHDYWEISKVGHNSYVEVRNAFRDGQLDVRKCFLWAPKFKTRINPDWVASTEDADRPKYMYIDLLPPWMSSSRGNKVSRLTDEIIEKLGLDINPKSKR